MVSPSRLWWVLPVLIAAGWALTLAGCAVTPADRAFVEASSVYYARTWPTTAAAIRSDATLLDVERRNLLGLVYDYGIAVEENEIRAGLKKREPERGP